jgi:hypothetical protein
MNEEARFIVLVFGGEVMRGRACVFRCAARVNIDCVVACSSGGEGQLKKGCVVLARYGVGFESAVPA